MTKSRRTTQKKYLLALQDLYNKLDTQNDVNVSEFIKDHKLNTNFMTILRKQNIILDTNYGYKWNSTKPDRKMTLHVLQQINEYRFDYDQMTKQKSNPVVDKGRSTSFDKYAKVLDDIYFLLQFTNDISMNEYCKKENISKNVPNALCNIGVLQYKDRKWRWIGSKPNNGTVKALVQKQVEFNKRDKVVKPKPEIKVEAKKVDTVDYLSIKLFWGLVKIKAKPIYK